MTTRIIRPPGVVALEREGMRQASEDVRATQSFRFPSGDGIMPVRPPRGAGPRPPTTPVSAAENATFTKPLSPPWIQKIGAISKDFNEQDFTLVIAAGAGSQVVGPSFRLPSANVGWLQQFQLYVLSQTAATDLQWTLRMNGGPVPGFANKRNPPGVANLVLIDLNGLQVPVPQGALVDFVITNIGGAGPFTVGGGFAGWHHPLQAEIDRWGPR